MRVISRACVFVYGYKYLKITCSLCNLTFLDSGILLTFVEFTSLHNLSYNSTHTHIHAFTHIFALSLFLSHTHTFWFRHTHTHARTNTHAYSLYKRPMSSTWNYRMQYSLRTTWAASTFLSMPCRRMKPKRQTFRFFFLGFTLWHCINASNRWYCGKSQQTWFAAFFLVGYKVGWHVIYTAKNIWTAYSWPTILFSALKACHRKRTFTIHIYQGSVFRGRKVLYLRFIMFSNEMSPSHHLRVRVHLRVQEAAERMQMETDAGLQVGRS